MTTGPQETLFKRAVGRLVAAILLVCVLLPAAQAQEAWAHYRNSRFGTSIDYQEFFEKAAASANGDGQAWEGPEGAKFSVFASENAQRQTLASYERSLKSDGDHDSLTYRSARAGRLVLSGSRGSNIYYEVYLFPPSGRIHGFLMEYPAKWKRDYDPTVGRMARSFHGD